MCLKPEEHEKEESVWSIIKVSRALPFKISETLLSGEWKLLRIESNLIKNIDKSIRIYRYWQNIFKIKNAINDYKYPLIIKVVKADFCLFHKSASILHTWASSCS